MALWSSARNGWRLRPGMAAWIERPIASRSSSTPETYPADTLRTMPELVLGPLLRHVGETGAVIWVETDAPCEVEVLGTRERTFCVCDHHYALVCCGGLERGAWHEYEVKLDGERVWPVDDGFPRSAFRTYPKEGALQVKFGSCRLAAPHAPPYSLRKDEDPRGREVDALHTLAQDMRNRPREEWPDVLLMLGDQVYADEVSPAARAFLESRRDPSEPPGERVLDFDDLRRPRRARRLEHLRGLARGDAAARVVEPAHSGRAGLLLGLPAPRQPEPRRPEGPRAAAPREGGGRRRADPGGVRAAGGPGSLRRTVELRPRPRPHPAGGDRLARRPGAGGGQPLDARRERVGLGRGAGDRRLRPRARGHLPPLAARPRNALRRGVERGGGRRRLGSCVPAAGREGPPDRRPRALGGIPGVLRPPRRAAPLGGRRRARPGARLGRGPVRGRAPRLPLRGRLPAGLGSAVERLPGGLLALPKSAWEQGAEGYPHRDVARPRGVHPGPGPLGRRGGSGRALADDRRRTVVRQPGRHARDRRPADRDAARQGGASGQLVGAARPRA